MNSLLCAPPDHVVTPRPRTHWVDTDVMVEVYSHGDVYRAGAAAQLGITSGQAGTLEERRVRMQRSLWLVMALCRLQAVSLSYQHENLRNMLRLAPPDSSIGVWTSAILYVLGDGGVYNGWDRLLTTSGEGLSDRDRDRLTARACAAAPITRRVEGMTPERQRRIAEALAEIRVHTQGPLVLATYDGRLTREARAANVDVDRPEVIAARTLTREDARAMFDLRLGEAMDRYVARGPLDEWLRRARAMENLARVYREIWRL